MQRDEMDRLIEEHLRADRNAIVAQLSAPSEQATLTASAA
jgi:hypothetical protein